MESERITIRIPRPLMDAAKKKAGKSSMGEYARALIERDTGVAADPQRGMAGAPARVRKAAGRKGGVQRAKNLAEKNLEKSVK